MFDPVKNARHIGILLVLISIYGFVKNIGLLNNIAPEDRSELIPWIGAGLIISLIYFVVAFGLMKRKLWAVYGVVVLAVLQVIKTFVLFSQEVEISKSDLFEIGLLMILFVWFYSSAKRFEK